MTVLDALMSVYVICTVVTALWLIPSLAKRSAPQQWLGCGLIYTVLLGLQFARESIAWRGGESIWVASTNALIPIAAGYLVAWALKKGLVRR